MSEAVEIPVRVANIEKAIVEIQRLGDEAKKAGEKQKKELSEIEKLMKKSLGADFAAQQFTKIGNALGGVEKKAFDAAGAIVQGFGQAGPLGAVVGAAVAGFEALTNHIKEAEAAAQGFADESAARASALSSRTIKANSALAEQIALRDEERRIRAAGGDVADAKERLALTRAQARVEAIREGIPLLEQEITKSQEAAEFLKLYDGQDQSSFSERRKRQFAELRAEAAQLDARVNARATADKELEIREKELAAAGIETARKTNTAIAKADKELRDARKKAAEEAAQFAFQKENERILAARKAAKEQAAWLEKGLRAREDAEDDARGRQVAREREWEAERAEFEAAGVLARQEQRREIERRFDDEEMATFVAEQKKLAAVEAAPLENLARSYDSLAESTVAAGVAAVISGESMGEAMQAAAAATLEGIAIESAVEALKNTAQAIAAVATQRYDAATAHGLAAAKFAATALAAGAGAAALGGSASAPAGGGGASAGAGAGAGATATGPQAPARETRESTIIINGGSLFMTRDELSRDLRLALDTHERRR